VGAYRRGVSHTAGEGGPSGKDTPYRRVPSREVALSRSDASHGQRSWLTTSRSVLRKFHDRLLPPAISAHSEPPISSARHAATAAAVARSPTTKDSVSMGPTMKRPPVTTSWAARGAGALAWGEAGLRVGVGAQPDLCMYLAIHLYIETWPLHDVAITNSTWCMA